MATRRRPPDEIKRRKEVRQRFRTIVRLVMFNKIWLADAEEQKMSLNVKRNIAMLFRTHEKIGTLTVAEKTIIRTLHGFRSIEDRKSLVTLLAGLTCFQTLPPKVRARLVPYVKFMLVKSGRTIIREGDEPHMIFFILSGEVEVTKKVYDHVTQAYVEKIQFILGSGDYVGDIALLEDTFRKRTYVSRADTELLVLYDEDDFNRILRPVMSKQWENKKLAIRSLDYFNFFTDEQIIIACKLGHLKQFDSLETIYHEDRGAVTFVHFIISGECMILQCLKMRAKTRNKKRKSFELVEITKQDVDEMFKNKSKQELLEMMLKENQSENKLPDKEETPSELTQKSRKGKKAMESGGDDFLRSIEIKCGLRSKTTNHKNGSSGAFHSSLLNEEIMEEEPEEEEESEEEEEVDELEENSEENEYGTPEEALAKAKLQKTRKGKDESKSGKSVLRKKFKSGEEEVDENGENEEQESYESESSKESTSEASFLATRATQIEDSDVKVENHFIDVGSMTFGGIFGLGEKLEHRVIMARTTVQCLMLPRFWLFEKEQNPGNVWQRRKFYLNSTIPSRQSLFKDFITTRKWQAFKTEFIQSNLVNLVGNPTKIQDVPIICRIVEANDD